MLQPRLVAVRESHVGLVVAVAQSGVNDCPRDRRRGVEVVPWFPHAPAVPSFLAVAIHPIPAAMTRPVNRQLHHVNRTFRESVKKVDDINAGVA